MRKMRLQDIKKRYGLAEEAINFYIHIGKIKRGRGRDVYKVPADFDDIILEKSTVYKYCVVDSWQEDIRDYVNMIKYTGRVKNLSPEEIKKYEQELLEREANALGTQKNRRLPDV